MSSHIGRRGWRNYVLATAAILGGLAVALGQSGAPVEPSPHAAALALVLTREAVEISRFESDHQAWWHDTKKRQWTVIRPFSPGILDSTHSFIVSYAIDGADVAQWNVDTRKAEVKRVEGSRNK